MERKSDYRSISHLVKPSWTLYDHKGVTLKRRRWKESSLLHDTDVRRKVKGMCCPEFALNMKNMS